MDNIDYSLLEIIERPKRISNISHFKLFDYLLQAKESQDRFESFILSLANNQYFAAFGFALMCSDIVPLKDIFKNKFPEADSSKKPNGGSEISTFQQLLTYFDRKYILKSSNLDNFTHHTFESLAYDEYMFVITIFSQKYKNEVYPAFKQMYDNGKLPQALAEWFAFSMTRKAFNTNTFTSFCYPLTKYTKYYKVRNVLLDEKGKFIDDVIATKILASIKNISGCNISEVYVENNIPFMTISQTFSSIIAKPHQITDNDFIEMIYKGYTTFLFTERYDILSIADLHNKFISPKKITCKSIKKLNIEYPVKNIQAHALFCIDNKDNEYFVYIPESIHNSEFSNDSVLTIIEYQNKFYLTK